MYTDRKVDVKNSHLSGLVDFKRDLTGDLVIVSQVLARGFKYVISEDGNVDVEHVLHTRRRGRS